MKYEFLDPVCGKSRAAFWLRNEPGRPPWVVVCANDACRALGGGPWLRELGEHVGARGDQLLEDAPTYLDLWVYSSDDGRPAPPPSEADREHLRRCRLRLRRDPAVGEYLENRRGIGRGVLLSEHVGWDDRRGVFTFPYFAESGALVGWKTREPGAGQQMKNCVGKGRPWPLYGVKLALKLAGKLLRVFEDAANDDEFAVYDDPGVFVVAGELDALCGLSHGVPTVSVPLGAGAHWREAWTKSLAWADEIYVCFDNNEAAQAMQAHQGLKARRGVAWDHNVHICKLPGWLGEKADLSDYLLLPDGLGDVDALRHRARRGA